MDGRERESDPVSAPSSGELLRRIVERGPRASYALRGEIARGGMGAILRVWDGDLGRELAMKVVLGDRGEAVRAATPGSDGRRVARFLEEARVTGQLDHPGVVPVHELGLDDQGRVYFTMRLVRGQELGRVLELVREEREGWNEARALGVLLRVCEALAYAHSKGVIHRDLKPANVMVGAFGEVYVMDWGLARVLGRADERDLRLRQEGFAPELDDGVVTLEGDVLGTPAYMAPEQARGRLDEITARSDVYSLGALLYHLLARRRPYAVDDRPASGLEVLRAVLAGPPRPLRDLRRDVPAELEAICEKAMARDARERYADTLELAQDLRAFLEGRVVRAYATGAWVELRKWVSRNRALAAAAGLALVFLAVGLAASLWQKSVADGNARRAEAVGGFLTGMLASADPRNALRRDMPVSAVVDEAARRLDAGEFADDPSTELALRRALGGAYRAIHRFEQSERQFVSALDLLEHLSGADRAERLTVSVDLADVRLERGDIAGGALVLGEALEELERENVADALLLPRALSVGSVLRFNLGDPGEALALARRALDLRAAEEGEDSEGCALLRSRIAFLMVRAGDFDAALELADAAIQRLRTGSPLARVEASAALRVRADIHARQRRMTEVLADLEQALALRRELFGDESTEVADVRDDLALRLMSAGRLREAEEHAQAALEVRTRLLGAHRDTATTLSTLGTILGELGRLDDARGSLEEGLRMRRDVLPEGNVAVADSQRRLARVALAQGEVDEAEGLLRASIANWQRNLGEDHPDLAENRLELGRVLRLSGHEVEARPLLERALEVRMGLFGPLGPSTCEARDELLECLLDLGEFAQVERTTRALLEILAREPRATPTLQRYTEAQLGAALLGLGRPQEAEPLLLAAWDEIGSDTRLWAVNKLFILDRLIELTELRGDQDAARAWREKAAALRR